MTSSTVEFTRATPWLFELAAKLENEPVDNLYRDAGTISRSLTGAADLFDLPAVCVPIDTTLEAQAVGCGVDQDAFGSAVGEVDGIIETVDDAFDVDIAGIVQGGRVPTMIDAAERLAETCDATVLGGVTGPGLLTEQLLADPEEAPAAVREEAAFTAGELGVELAGKYLDAGADGIALLEPTGLDAPMYGEAVEPIANLISHYEAGSVVVTERARESDIRTAGKLGFDWITGAVDDPNDALATAAETDIRLAIGVPRDAFVAGASEVASFREQAPDEALLTSEWVVPAETTPEAVHELMGE